MYAFFKKMAEICDEKLIRKVDYLKQKSKKLNHSDLTWINDKEKRFDDSRFQLNNN